MIVDHVLAGSIPVGHPGVEIGMLPQDFDAQVFAKSAYNAYGEVTGFRNYAGLPMPAWEDLTPKIQEAWRAAVSDVAVNLLKTRT